MNKPTVHVEPAVVRDGAKAFAAHHDELHQLIDTVHKLHTDLHETWTGPAATAADDEWTDSHARLRQHANRLAVASQRLLDAEGAYGSTDAANGEDINRA